MLNVSPPMPVVLVFRDFQNLCYIIPELSIPYVEGTFARQSADLSLAKAQQYCEKLLIRPDQNGESKELTCVHDHKSDKFLSSRNLNGGAGSPDTRGSILAFRLRGREKTSGGSAPNTQKSSSGSD